MRIILTIIRNMNLDMALLCMQQARGRSAVDEEGRACLPRCWSTTCPERKWGTEDLVCFLITSSPPAAPSTPWLSTTRLTGLPLILPWTAAPPEEHVAARELAHRAASA
jgi:hypothetical protein